MRAGIVELALDAPDLSPREIAVRFIDEQGYFVSEDSAYCLLKAMDLITSVDVSQSTVMREKPALTADAVQRANGSSHPSSSSPYP